MAKTVISNGTEADQKLIEERARKIVTDELDAKKRMEECAKEIEASLKKHSCAIWCFNQINQQGHAVPLATIKALPKQE